MADMRPPVRIDLLKKNHDRVLHRVMRSLDAPLPKPRDPRRMRSLWILVGVVLGLLIAGLFLISPLVVS